MIAQYPRLQRAVIGSSHQVVQTTGIHSLLILGLLSTVKVSAKETSSLASVFALDFSLLPLPSPSALTKTSALLGLDHPCDPSRLSAHTVQSKELEVRNAHVSSAGVGLPFQPQPLVLDYNRSTVMEIKDKLRGRC